MRLLFSTNNLPGSILIRWFAWSDWSHVDVMSPDGMWAIGAHPWKGVQMMATEDVKRKNSAWAEVDFDCDTKIAWAFAQSHINRPYDYGAIFNFVGAGRKWEHPERWMCSELGFCSADAAKCEIIRKPPTRCTPQDLYESSRGILIRQGKR